MSIQFGRPPRKTLDEAARRDIATILGRDSAELVDLFRSLEEIITAYSPAAMPLAVPANRAQSLRALKKMAKAAEALETAWQGCDGPTGHRILFGLILTQASGAPIGADFRLKLAQFRDLLRSIEESLQPPRGGKAASDHLRAIAMLCAAQYQKALGEWPARRTDGRFHKMMNIVLRAIGMKLPTDPSSSILKPAVDAAIARATPPEESPPN